MAPIEWVCSHSTQRSLNCHSYLQLKTPLELNATLILILNAQKLQILFGARLNMKTWAWS